MIDVILDFPIEEILVHQKGDMLIEEKPNIADLSNVINTLKKENVMN